MDHINPEPQFLLPFSLREAGRVFPLEVRVKGSLIPGERRDPLRVSHVAFKSLFPPHASISPRDAVLLPTHCPLHPCLHLLPYEFLRPSSIRWLLFTATRVGLSARHSREIWTICRKQSCE